MIEYALLAKAMAPLAGKAAAVVAQKTIAGKKAAWAIAAEVSEATTEFSVSKSRLRTVIQKRATIDALCDENPEHGAREAVRLFKAELRRQETWRNLDADELERRCARVVEETAKALVKNLPVPTALALVDSRNAARDEATRTRDEETRQGLETIRAQTAGPSLLDRADLHPSIDSDVRVLVEAFPRASALVDIFTNAMNPGDDLAAWVDDPPSWLREAPLKAWTILGISLSVLDRPAEGAAAIMHAVSEGVADRRRWEAHAAHLLSHKDPVAARELIAHHTEGHGAALLATLDDDYPQALIALNDWHPENDFDRDTRALLTAAVLEAQGENLRAIKTLRERRPDALGTGITLKLAKLLLAEAYAGRATSRDDQLREVSDLAIEVRELRRRWRGDSVDPTLVAAGALGLLHDHPTAWKHLRPPPDGDALPHEANHPDIKVRAATVATALGDLSLAAQLGDAAEAYTAAFLAAVRLEDAGDMTEAGIEAVRDAWANALEHATDDIQRLWAVTRLLIFGGDSPMISELRQRVPAGFEDIDEVIGVLTGSDQRVAISRLRGIRKTNRLAVMTLSDLYDQQSRPDDAANVLAEAADTFDDQHLRLMAATRWSMTGNLAKAAEEARRALEKAGTNWSGRPRAQQVILDDLSTRGEWPDFIIVARQYLAGNPDPAVRWALAFAHMQGRDPDSAWRVISESPTPLHPLEPLHALLYLKLLARFGPREQVIREAVTALNRFGLDDERFAAAVFAATVTPPEDEEEPTEEPPIEMAELGGLMDTFAERYPASRYFWRFVGDPDDPEGSLEQTIEALVERLKPGHERRVQLENDVGLGLHPTGILTSAVGRTYAEGFLLQAGGGLRVRSWIPAQQQADQADADSFIATPSAPSVVDASALHTCSLLPDDVRDIVMACHERLLLTTESMADLAAARDSVAITDGQFGLDRDGNPRVSEQDNVTLGQRAQLMVDLANRAEVIPSAKAPEVAAKDADRFQPWLFLPPTAQDHQAYLWCDDAALRRSARAWGIPTFGTLELVEALVAQAALSNGQRDEIRLTLISYRTFDMHLSAELLAVQAAKDGWRAGAVTATLARPASWMSARILLDLLDEATRHNAATPDHMAAWLYAATMGSCRMLDDPSAITDLAKVLLLRTLIGAGLAPTMTPPIVLGVRAAIQELSAPDPLPAALKELNETLLTHYEPPAATQLIINTAVGLDAADRQAAVRAILGIT